MFVSETKAADPLRAGLRPQSKLEKQVFVFRLWFCVTLPTRLHAKTNF